MRENIYKKEPFQRLCYTYGQNASIPQIFITNFLKQFLNTCLIIFQIPQNFPDSSKFSSSVSSKRSVFLVTFLTTFRIPHKNVLKKFQISPQRGRSTP